MPFTFERGGDIYCPENMAVNLDGITYKLNDETAFDIVDAVITKYTRITELHSNGRRVVKNPELMALIEEHHLTSKMISDMLDVPFETVRNWRRNETSSATKMSKANLKLLKLSLAK
jgi:DNA-binding transcriptional regulator YiaG